MFKVNQCVVIFFIAFFSKMVVAAGPEKIAYFDRGLWPENITGEQQFDRASRFEIFQFSRALMALDYSDIDNISRFTGVKNPNKDSIQKWVTLTTHRLLGAYTASCLSQSKAFGCDKAVSLFDLHNNMIPAYNKLGADYDGWKTASTAFHTRYLYEQVRLAALFPRVTSEILTFNDDEITGFEFADREFLLTFDDGPSKNKTTEKVISTLNKLNLNAVFFVLGENLANNSKPENLAKVYAGHCVASHGFTHKAHPRLKTWKDSINKTNNLITRLFNINADGILFRPPYGQRTVETLTYMQTTSKNRNMLWNIDSQDWNRKIKAGSVSDRVTTLMLLWRKGTILFHDLYLKNISVINTLHDFTGKADLKIKRCEEYSEQVSAKLNSRL